MGEDKKYVWCHVNQNPFEEGYCDGMCFCCDYTEITREEAEARIKELKNDR